MNKIALSGLALGTAMVVSTAQAEPLTLTADQMDTVTAAGTARVDAFKTVDIRERIDKDVFIVKFKDIFQRVDVQGWFAEANGAANCFGSFGCEALTFAITDVDAFSGFATSVSGSEAATNGFDFVGGNGPE